MTGTVVKQTESDPGEWLGTDWGFVGGLCGYDGEPVTLEAYQLAFMRNRSRFRWVTKSRQVGYSFVFALEALARPAHRLLHRARPARHLQGDRLRGAAQVPTSHSTRRAVVALLVPLHRREARRGRGPGDADRGVRRHVRPAAGGRATRRCRSTTSIRSSRASSSTRATASSPYELSLTCTDADLSLADDFSDLPFPEGRLVAGFDVGRIRDRSDLALFEDVGGRCVCRPLRRYDQAPFAEQESDLRRMMGSLPIARLSIDRSGVGMTLAENLTRDFPQVVGEAFSNESKERWATDL